jgi:hypothetical protein
VRLAVYFFIISDHLIYINFKYEALRRVHLIPSEETPEETEDTVNANVFRNLDSSVSESGENFSTGLATKRYIQW